MLVLAALLLFPRATFGQDVERQPFQELFLTEVVYPQEKGDIQLTIGSLVDRSRPDLAALVPFSIEYGLTNRWQVEAGWDGYTQFHQSPFSHLRTARLSIGTKYSFMNIAKSRVHAAVGIDAEFPRPDAFADGEGEDAMEIEPVIAVAADLTSRVGVFGSAAASIVPREIKDLAEGERPDDPGTISAGAFVAFHHATVAVEYTNRTDSLPWRLDGAALITPSIVVHPSGRWEFGLGAPVGLRGHQHRPGLALNLVREF